MEKEIIIYPKYNFKEFCLPIKQKILKSWSTYFIVSIAIIMLFFDIVFWFNLYDRSLFNSDKLPIFNIIFPFMILLILPFLGYFLLKKQFNSNYILKEKTTVKYSLQGIDTKGESYQINTEWDKIKDIKEYKSFFSFKNINGQTSYLPKSFFSSDDLNRFKLLIKEIGY